MILVLSGTSDGREIVKELLSKGSKVLASTATEYGGDLLSTNKNLIINTQPLDINKMQNIITEYQIEKVIDATHPYASIVSANAMEVCSILELPYYRYERENVDYNNWNHVVSCKDYEDVIEYLNSNEGNVLLTTGSNELQKFEKVNDLKSLYARVLPTNESLGKCMDLGLSPKQIIGMQGPFTKNLNNAIIEQLGIKIVVTKESSKAGAFEEKVESAREKDCTLLVINRPQIKYINKYNSISDLIKEIYL